MKTFEIKATSFMNIGESLHVQNQRTSSLITASLAIHRIVPSSSFVRCRYLRQTVSTPPFEGLSGSFRAWRGGGSKIVNL